MSKSVAVVGAGLAGLNAARVLKEESGDVSLNVDLFEARERQGGRVESRTDKGVTWERGGEFIDEKNVAFRALAEKLDISLTKCYGDECYSTPIRIRLESGMYDQAQFNRDGAALFRAIGLDVTLLHTDPRGERARELKSISVGHYLTQFDLSDKFLEAFNALWEDEMGTSIDESPAIGLLELELENITPDQEGLFEHGYARYRVRGGASQFVAALGEKVGANLHLGSALTSVSETEQSVQLEFRAGGRTIIRNYDAAIIALPLSTLARVRLDDSGLSERMRYFIEHMPSAQHEKTIVRSNRTPNRAEMLVVDPEVGGSSWTSSAGRTGSSSPTALTVFHEHGEVPEDKALIARLRENYDGLKGARLAVMDRTTWTDDQYALGSYSQFGGSPDTRETLERVRSNTPANKNKTVTLAGEWASPEAYVQSHMEGALLSGERAARDTAKKLKS